MNLSDSLKRLNDSKCNKHVLLLFAQLSWENSQVTIKFEELLVLT